MVGIISSIAQRKDYGLAKTNSEGFEIHKTFKIWEINNLESIGNLLNIEEYKNVKKDRDNVKKMVRSMEAFVKCGVNLNFEKHVKKAEEAFQKWKKTE